MYIVYVIEFYTAITKENKTFGEDHAIFWVVFTVNELVIFSPISTPFLESCLVPLMRSLHVYINIYPVNVKSFSCLFTPFTPVHMHTCELTSADHIEYFRSTDVWRCIEYRIRRTSNQYH